MWVREAATKDLWVQTATGRRFDLPEPRLDQIHMADIAIGLAREGRYGNQTGFRWLISYSVAQHVVHCSRVCPAELAWDCLMHDAAEAYLGDVPKPFKRMLQKYQDTEEAIMGVLAERFDFRWPLLEGVKIADTIAFLTERRDLMAPPPSPWAPHKAGIQPDPKPIKVWSTKRAYREFVCRVAELRPDLSLADVPHALEPVAQACRRRLRRRGHVRAHNGKRPGLTVTPTTGQRRALQDEFGAEFAGFPLRVAKG